MSKKIKRDARISSSSKRLSARNSWSTQMQQLKHERTNSNAPLKPEIEPGMRRHNNGNNNRSKKGRTKSLPDNESKHNKTTDKLNLTRSWKRS